MRAQCALAHSFIEVIDVIFLIDCVFLYAYLLVYLFMLPSYVSHDVSSVFVGRCRNFSRHIIVRSDFLTIFHFVRHNTF